MRRLTTAIFTITVAAHLPFGWGLAAALDHAGAPAPKALAISICAALIALLPGRLTRLRADNRAPFWKVRLVEEPWYAHWCATLLACPLLALAAIGLSLHALSAGAAGLLDRLAVAALSAYLAALALTAYGVMIRRRWVRIRTVEIPVPGLGERFDGYRIAHLSDLHVGGLWPREAAEAWVRKVAELDVDLVASTGDYITHGGDFHADAADLLSSLRARDGVVAVMGNHDYFGDGEALIRALRARGVTVLRNERIEITRGEEAITIAGVDDTWSRRADPEAALRGAIKGRPVITLAHDPQLFPALAALGSAVVLAGHTHWGQLAVPFLPTRWNLSRLSYRLHAGSYSAGQAILLVSPGLGTTGPPLRIGAPPEITLLRLRCLSRSVSEGVPSSGEIIASSPRPRGV